MPDLLSLLNFGAAGIAAQNAGVGIAANNVSNATTEGYSRQRGDLESLEASPYIGGVRSGDPTRYASDMLSTRIRTAGGALAMSQAFADALSDLEQRVSGGGPTIDEQLGDLFSKFSQVAATPTDPASRDAVVSAARNLVAGIRKRAADVDAARREADARIRDSATKANDLAKQLAIANKAVATSNDPVAKDHRDLIAKQLAAVVGGQATIGGDGQMRFVLDGGAVLVDGIHAASLEAKPDPTTGLAQVAVVDGDARRDVTHAIGGGQMGADLKFRDTTASRVAGQLDQLAFDVTQKFNAVHSANAGLDGVTGRNMFVPVTQVAGAAQAIALDPGLDADSDELAVGAPGAGPGDNTGALAMFGLASSTSLTGDALGVISGVAQDGSAANADLQSDQLISDHLDGLRDSLSGVDTQEELTNLSRFEHASQAMTKFVSTIDDMLGSLIDTL